MGTFILLAFLFLPFAGLAAEEDDKDALDPVYAKSAAATGGRVYDMSNPRDVQDFNREIAAATRQAKRANFREAIHLSDNQKLTLYAFLKWIAYSAWCWVGLMWSRRASPRVSALAWGLLRVALGLGFGYALAIPVILIAGQLPSGYIAYVILYGAVYIPVRWIEWTILSNLMNVDQRIHVWRLGGIGVSFLADGLQMVLIGSLIPIGRFVC